MKTHQFMQEGCPGAPMSDNEDWIFDWRERIDLFFDPMFFDKSKQRRPASALKQEKNTHQVDGIPRDFIALQKSNQLTESNTRGNIGVFQLQYFPLSVVQLLLFNNKFGNTVYRPYRITSLRLITNTNLVFALNSHDDLKGINRIEG